MFMTREKVPVVPESVRVEAVVATDTMIRFKQLLSLFVSVCLIAASTLSILVSETYAAVLPEDRADVMFHNYEGDGLTVNGPAVLVRKSFADAVSVRVNYYVDNITSASIDVVTTASPYKEYREEISTGVDYLYESTLINIGFTKSDENDYNASTFNFGLAQEVFGGLTTVSMGYAHGQDIITMVTDLTFEEDVARDQFTLGISQVLTKNSIISGSYEAISDQGFLNNPYRSARIDGGNPLTSNSATVPEVYPETRRSHAFSITGKQYLPIAGTVSGSIRYFTDTWGITAQNIELGYSQYLGSQSWIIDTHVRYYNQGKATFYQDSFATPQRYMARDKELSKFKSYGVGASVSYKFLEDWSFLDKSSVNLSVEYLQFNYDNFTDLRVDKSTYLKPFSFNAVVMQAFLSLWY